MAGTLDPQGSVWHRWDPHIHAPGTALNDQFGGEDPWEQFLTSVEKSDPPIRALGITDQKAKEQRRVAAEKTVLPRNRALVHLPREFAEREAGGRDTVAASSL